MSDKERPEDVLVGVMMDATRSDKHAVIYEALSHRIKSIEFHDARLALKAAFSFYSRVKSAPTMLDVDEEAKVKFAYEYDEAGGESTFCWEYLPHCYSLADYGGNTEWYIEKILSKAARKDIADIQRKYGPHDDIPHVISVIREELAKVEEGLFMGEKQTLGQEYKSMLYSILDGQQDCRRDLRLGIPKLDDMVGGIVPEDFVIIGARPSVGKTSFALSIAEAIMDDGHPISFYSYDMGKKQMLLRMLSFFSRLTVKEIKTKDFRDPHADAAKLNAAAAQIDKLPIYMTFEHLNCFSLCRSIRTDVKKRGVKAVFIDYIQIVPHPTFTKEYDAVTAVSKALKGLTHELDIPIFALAQLSRPQKGEERKSPHLSDLRNSGQLDQDASLVIMLHRPPEGQDSTILSRVGEAVVVKQQNGIQGRVQMEITKGFRWVEA